jgi:hypothetical protein
MRNLTAIPCSIRNHLMMREKQLISMKKRKTLVITMVNRLFLIQAKGRRPRQTRRKNGAVRWTRRFRRRPRTPSLQT